MTITRIVGLACFLIGVANHLFGKSTDSKVDAVFFVCLATLLLLA